MLRAFCSSGEEAGSESCVVSERKEGCFGYISGFKEIVRSRKATISQGGRDSVVINAQ